MRPTCAATGLLLLLITMVMTSSPHLCLSSSTASSRLSSLPLGRAYMFADRFFADLSTLDRKRSDEQTRVSDDDTSADSSVRLFSQFIMWPARTVH